MDHELMRGDAQDAIEAGARKRGMTPFLPSPVPFGSLLPGHDGPARQHAV